MHRAPKIGDSNTILLGSSVSGGPTGSVGKPQDVNSQTCLKTRVFQSVLAEPLHLPGLEEQYV